MAQVEFNPALLHGGNKVDVSRFSKGNPVLPGEYVVDQQINGKWLGRASVRLVAQPDSDISLPCVDRALIERMGHELIVELPPDPIWLHADPLRLAQVVGNLLNNASKFTAIGGCIRLTATTSGEEAVIRVRDNGAGIPSDQLPFVFDVFMPGSSAQ